MILKQIKNLLVFVGLLSVVFSVVYSIIYFCFIEIENKKVTTSSILDEVVIASACKRDVINKSGVVPIVDSCKPVVLVIGLIHSGTVTSFKDLIESANFLEKNIDTVCFASHGGNVSQGLELAKQIQIYGMNTCVADYYEYSSGKLGKNVILPYTIDGGVLCASTCPFVYLAGRERVLLGNRMVFRVHSAGINCNCGPFDTKLDVDFLGSNKVFYTMSQLVSDEHKTGVYRLYTKAVDTKFSAKDLLRISHEELLEMKVVTKWDRSL